MSERLYGMRNRCVLFFTIELYDKTGFAWIPFSCPDALIVILSDFILVLVEVTVVSSCREDDIKISVRSEPSPGFMREISPMLLWRGSGMEAAMRLWPGG